MASLWRRTSPEKALATDKKSRLLRDFFARYAQVAR